MPAKKRRVLKVFFKRELHKTIDGITPGGANFPFKFLKAFDIDERTIVLEGYNVFVEDEIAIFTGNKSSMPKIVVTTALLDWIKDCKSGKVIYSF